MTTELNWGLLSTAHINRRLIPAIRGAERGRLLAVASRSQSRAEAYATEWRIPRAYGSYQAMLSDPDIDVVYVSLPNSLHAEWTVKAAQSGKNVLCEKPLALSVAECDQIIGAAEAADVVVMEAIMVLYHPLHRHVREMIHEGAVGDVRLARGSLSFFLDRPDDVRWDPSLGGGSLWDVGSYPVSFIRWVVGEPEHVFGWQTLSESGVDKAFVGLLRYTNGVLGAFDCGFEEPFRSRAEVAGTEGTLVIERPYSIAPGSRLLLRRRQESKAEEVAVPKTDAYRCEVDAMMAAVLDGAELAVPLSSSRANVATLVALYESARCGQAQSIADA